MAVNSVTLYKDINNNFVYSEVVLDGANTQTLYQIKGLYNIDNPTFVLAVSNLTKEVSFVRYPFGSNNILPGDYLIVPANVNSFKFNLISLSRTSTINADLISLNIGGVNSTVESTDQILEYPEIPLGSETPVTPESLGDALQSTVGPNPYNYSEHFNRLITALEEISININVIRNTQDVLLNVLTDLTNEIKNGTSATIKISDVISGNGIPVRDAYAALSYSALIKVFEEEGVDIDALIAKTQTKLSGL